jgi:hypothetical protein
VPLPDLVDLADVYNITSGLFIDRKLLFLLIGFMLFFMIINSMKPKFIKFINTLNPSKAETPLIVIGIGFLLLPLVIWIISLSIKPIFIDRYMIPTLVGWVILIAFLTSRIKSEYLSPFVYSNIILKIFCCGFIVYALVKPVSKAIATGKEAHPKFEISDSDTLNNYASLPKVVTDTHKFMRLNYYLADRKNFYFILDWESAIHPNSGAFQPQTYKHMQAWRQNFPEYFSTNVLTSEEFLTKHRRFLVIDYPNYLKNCPGNQIGVKATMTAGYKDCPKWLETRILNNKKYKVELLSSDNTSSVLLVQRQDTVAF